MADAPEPKWVDFAPPVGLKESNGLAPILGDGDAPEVDLTPGGPRVVFFSSISENTYRFVTKLGFPAVRIPVYERRDPMPLVREPYVLIVPTYGGGNASGAVPKQVIHFLNIKSNRDLMRGVIASGQKNFAQYYTIAADIIAKKCNVPILYRFELMGTSEDARKVREGMEEMWETHSPQTR